MTDGWGTTAWCRITFSLEEGEVSFKIEDVVGGKQK